MSSTTSVFSRETHAVASARDVIGGKAAQCDHKREHARTSTGSGILTLNVGGVKFHCKRQLLSLCRRGRLDKIVRHNLDCGSASSSEHFFDRDPRFFPAILDFYRSGRLQLRGDLACLEQWKDELEFWDLSEAEDVPIHQVVRPVDVSLRKRYVPPPISHRQCPDVAGECPEPAQVRRTCSAVVGESPLISGQCSIDSGMNIHDNFSPNPKHGTGRYSVRKVKILFIMAFVLSAWVLTFVT